MGLAERAIAAISPEWAHRRSIARAKREIIQASGYDQHGASRRKKSLAGWQTSQGGPDSDIVDNLDTLRERSRDLCMGEGLAIGALKTIRTNEVGAGLRLNAQIDAKFLGLTPEESQAWEDRVERLFCLWADSKACDAARRCTFGELQALARLSQLMSGDVFALLPSIERAGDLFDLRVKLVEADVVCDPSMIPTGADILGGVEVGPSGEPIAYHFMDRHPGDVLAGHLRSIGIQKWTRVEAFGAVTGRPVVLHLMESERPGQRRGVPLLAPVMEKFKQLSRYTLAEIDAAVVSALFAAFVTTENPAAGPLGQVLTDDERAEVNEGPNDMQLASGMLVGLDPGQKVQEVNPTRPNAGFEPFVASLLKQIGVGIGVPYHVLVKFFDGSYNTSRAALLEFWKTINEGRSRMASGFCQPVYEAFLEEAILRGYIDAPGFDTDPLIRAAWCGAKWIGPTQGQLDPVKEVTAADMRVAAGYSSATDETMAMTGSDWWANNALRAREEQARKDAGLVGVKAVSLTPTANEAITRVNEGRAAQGLPPESDGDKETVLERSTRIQREAGINPNGQPPKQTGAAP